jgi:hypothetical protein
VSFLVKRVSNVRSKIEKCKCFQKGGILKIQPTAQGSGYFISFFKVYIQGPGLSMVGVLKAPKFEYLPELLKRYCQ